MQGKATGSRSLLPPCTTLLMSTEQQQGGVIPFPILGEKGKCRGRGKREGRHHVPPFPAVLPSRFLGGQ